MGGDLDVIGRSWPEPGRSILRPRAGAGPTRPGLAVVGQTLMPAMDMDAEERLREKLRKIET